MPSFFVEWLKLLSDEQAIAIWEYFDGSFTNCEDVIEVLSDSHHEVYKKLCGDDWATHEKMKAP